MKIWYNNVIDSNRTLVEVKGNRIRIGRSPQNEIVLNSPYIANEAVVMYRRGGVWELQALGLNGVTVGDQKIGKGERCEIVGDHQISLFPYTVSLELPRTETISRRDRRHELDNAIASMIAEIHILLLKNKDLKLDEAACLKDSDEYLLLIENYLEGVAASQSPLIDDSQAMTNQLAGHAVRDFLLARLTIANKDVTSQTLCRDRHWSRLVSAVPEREQELEQTAEYLQNELERNATFATDGNGKLSFRIKQVEIGFWDAWQKLGPHIHADFKRYLAMRYLKKEIKDILFGYGPLEDLLRLPAVSEIMVVDKDHVYVERNGVLENSGRRFISNEIIESIIQRIVAAVNRRIDKSSPLVDARLADGSRVNAIIPPLAVSGPALTIRKFPYRKLLVDDLVEKGSLTRTLAEFLRAIVLNHRNVLISGGTGTGKTTLLNCLSDFIPDGERIVTVEDTAELQLAKQHVVRLETKDANIEGTGEYSIRDLVKNALRMRPDRVVVGECRGAEALDMLQAMNTGHDGSLTTIHANNTKDVIHRLEVLVQMAADLPVSSIRQQIGSAIDIIIQLKRLRNGKRCISQVTEVVGVDPSSGEMELRDLYLLEKGQAEVQATGRLPTFIGDLVASEEIELSAFYC